MAHVEDGAILTIVARSQLPILPALGLTAAAALVTLPLWGMWPAAFIDSDRTILSRAISPGRTHVAQVERLVVGGVPSIIVTVRPAWMRNWYLLGCAAASHYEECSAHLRWASDHSLTVVTPTGIRFWRTDGAPFYRNGCTNLSVTVTRAS